MAFYDRLLKDDEQLIRLVRSFPLAFFWPLLISLLLLLAPFFLAVPLFEVGVIGSIAFALMLLVGLTVLIRTLTLAYFNCFVITDRRVIDWDQRGVFDRVISEAEYDKVQDISYRIKGVVGTLLDYGTIQIQTAGAAPVLELRFVRHPQRVQALITDVKRNYSQESSRS